MESLEKEVAREKEAGQLMLNEMERLNEKFKCERLQWEESNRAMSIDIKMLKSYLENANVMQSRLAEDKTRLSSELEACQRQYAELQGKFYEATSEKEKLLKEIVELSKRQAEWFDPDKQIEFQVKLEEKLDQLQTRLDKTKRMSGQFKSPGVSSSNMNESFIVKIDNQIETKLQNKVSKKKFFLLI